MRSCVIPKFTAVGAVVLALATAATIAAKGTGSASSSKTTYTGATGVLRSSCSIAADNCVRADPTDPADRIVGDGAPYVGRPEVSTTLGSFLVTYPRSTYDDFYLELDGTNGRYLFLDFTRRSGPGTCGTSCRLNFVAALISSTWGGQGLLVRPLDPTTWAPLPGGMGGIPVGQRVPAGLKLNFADPSGRTLVWTVRFNATAYAPSSYVYVTRIDQYTWKIAAGASNDPNDLALAELVASPSGSVQKQTDEGTFVMPFQITVTQP